jgi:hypothetical protein
MYWAASMLGTAGVVAVTSRRCIWRSHHAYLCLDMQDMHNKMFGSVALWTGVLGLNSTQE